MALASIEAYGQTAANTENTGGGTRNAQLEWNQNSTSPSDALAEADYAEAGVGSSKETDWLDISDFDDIVVPTGATITGVTVKIHRYSSNTDPDDSDIVLFNGASEGDNLSAGAAWPGTTATTATFGGAAEMWGLSIAPGDMSDLKVRIAAVNTGSNSYVRVYWVSITVHYTLAGIGDEAGWWCPTLDEPSVGSTTLVDLTETGNDGTLTNMTTEDWLADTGNGGIRCLDFDGSGDLVKFGDVLDRGTGDWSMSLWMWIHGSHSSSTSGGRIMQKRGTGGGGTQAGWQFVVRQTGSDVMLINSYIDDGSDYKGLTFGDGETDLGQQTTWMHVVMTVEHGSATGWKFYVDDVLIDTFDISAVTGSLDNARELTLGASDTTETQYMRGRLDDIRLFDRIITADEISHLYNSGDGRGILGAPATGNSLLLMNRSIANYGGMRC